MATVSQLEIQIIKAFEEIAPQSASSSCLPIKKVPYDVFINHRGPDVKSALATNIYDTLDRMGLRVFLDKEELELGDSIPDTLQEAMRNASLHIAIFSPNYAQSPWCLAELSFMLKTEAVIVPVFYHVDPSDLRWVVNGKGIYAVAFCEHEEKGRYTAEKIKEWKLALQNVSFRVGHILNNSNNDEGSLLKSIVNSVTKVMKRVPLEVAAHPVGLNKVIEELERTTLQTDQNVKIVGIVGMGGSGKTTLAKELYNRKYQSFKESSFLFDVRDAASKNALHDLQKKLLEDLHAKGSTINNMHEGKGILASRLRSLHVLIMLDDIDHVDQMDALLPMQDNLGPGSLIVVTTRERDVLTSWNITSIYDMRGLGRSHSEQLFCWHAFLQPYSLPGFQDLVNIFVDGCNGLPLSLKVLGGQLYKKSKDYWESQLHKISRILPKDITQRLKVSYDALDVEEQQVFLDIACFFIGERKSLGIEVWNASELSGLHSLERLVNKCLIELDQNNHIRMHDHLRDMGKEIADMKSPYRIWSPRQIKNTMKQAKESMLIRGIMAATTKFDPMGIPVCSSHYEPPLDECMENSWTWLQYLIRPSLPSLNFLVVKDKCFKKRFGKLSRDLLWLRWFDFKYKKLPLWLSLNNVRVLELYGAEGLKELWVDNAHIPSQLTQLMVFECTSLQRIPKSIGCLAYLKQITFIGNYKTPIEGLPEGFCDLKSLEHLELQKCSKLSSLPTRFGDLTNLRHLALNYCKELRMLPNSFKQLSHLQYLDLSFCSKLTFTPGNLDILENITMLDFFDFQGCDGLQQLPHHITNQAFLRQLNIRCIGLRELPNNMGNLENLQMLVMKCPLLTSLPSSIGNLSRLTRLEIYDCEKLESLPESMKCLNLLEYLNISYSGVKSFPTDFWQLTNLQTLNISHCPYMPLEFVSCSMSRLKSLSLQYTQVSRISISQASCPILEAVVLESNDHLMEIETLPLEIKTARLSRCKLLKNITGIRYLGKLQELHISGCPELDELPSLAQLVSVENFLMMDCPKVKMIEGLEHLRSLKRLRVHTFWEVSGIRSYQVSGVWRTLRN